MKQIQRKIKKGNGTVNGALFVAIIATVFALTGAASAFNIDIGGGNNPTVLEPGDSVKWDLSASFIDQLDANASFALSSTVICSKLNPCNKTNVAATIASVLGPVTSPTFSRANATTVKMSANPSDANGTRYIIAVQAGPDGGKIGEFASATRNVFLVYGSITGNKTDENGIGLANWTITLRKPDGTTISAVTDQNGSYKFDKLHSGTYVIGEMQKPNYIQVSPGGSGTYTVVLKAGENIVGKNFVNKKVPPPGRNKIVGSGNTASGTFKVWVYSHFLPRGTVEFTDASKNIKIEAISISSISTDKTATPMTGVITGQATVNGNGNYAFTVNVKDRGNPPADSDDAIEISVPDIGYSGGGKVLRGDIEIIY